MIDDESDNDEDSEPAITTEPRPRGLALIKPRTWHQRLGHVNFNDMKNIGVRNLCSGITLDNGDMQEQKEHFCVACVTSKAHAAPIFKRHVATRATERLALLHMDLCGPFPVVSAGRHRYYLIVVDDYSRFTFVYPLVTKDAALIAIKLCISLAENFVGKPVRAVRTDGGGEFIGATCAAFFNSKGIEHQRSAPYTPQQNGVAERANRTVTESVRAMMHFSGANRNLWHEAVRAAVHIKNRLPHAAIDPSSTPYELWKERRPDVSHLRVWGCTAYALKPAHMLNKLDVKTKTCILVGFGHDEGQRAYRLFDRESRQIIISRNVIFDENSFITETPPGGAPFLFQPMQPELSTANDEAIQRVRFDDDEDAPVRRVLPLGERGNAHPLQAQDHDESDSDNDDAAAPIQPQANDIQLNNNNNNNNNHAINEGGQHHHGGGADQERNDGGMIDQFPLHDDDHVPDAAPGRSTRVRSRTTPFWHQALSALDDIPQQPKSYHEAMLHKEWRDAIGEENNSLIENAVFAVVDLPSNRRALGTRYVLRVKLDANGDVSRFKARLVAQGFAQQHGIDYEEVYAPVAKFTTLRAILAIAASTDAEIHQMDVCTAFLNGVLQEEVYVQIPPGFDHHGVPGKVWRLHKSLYGLKQSPRTWNLRLHQFLIGHGFKRLDADHSVYVRPSPTGNAHEQIIIAVYVDDLVIVAPSSRVTSTKKLFTDEFKMTDLGEISWLLGMQVIRDRYARTISLNQTQYANEILALFKMSDCKGISTPLDLLKLTREMCPQSPDDAALMERIPYQSAIGSLMYLMLGTRPDLAAAVGILSQFASSPGPQHWVAVKRVLRYIKQTADFQLTLGGSSPGSVILEGWSDADWAGDVSTRRSTSGYAFTLGQGVISWSSKRQTCVSLSSTEAEYVAIANAARELVWLRSLLAELSHKQKEPTVLHEDNQGAIALVKNPINHARTKHIDIAYHFIRDLYERKILFPIYCKTSEMAADALTKALSRAAHEYCVMRYGLTSSIKK
jgi:transposase InsO family protein